MTESTEIGESTPWILCPVCNCKKFYKNQRQYIAGKNKNKPCRSCSNSLSKGGTGNRKENEGKKKCSNCYSVKSVEEFFRIKRGTFMSICKECSMIKSKKYNKEYYRFKKYGIDKNQYINLFASQDNKCAICKTDKARFCIDHCHTTGTIRGILCKDCNIGIGLLRESNENLLNAIKYLNNAK